jgi:hypothetical protein
MVRAMNPRNEILCVPEIWTKDEILKYATEALRVNVKSKEDLKLISRSQIIDRQPCTKCHKENYVHVTVTE